MENNIYGLFHSTWEMLAAGDQKIMFIVKVGNQLGGKLSKYFFSTYRHGTVCWII